MENRHVEGDAGPSLAGISGIAREPDGQWVVIATNNLTGASQVARIDSATGDRAIVSDANTGGGPALQVLRGIAVEASGQLLVVDTDLKTGRVLRVDPVSGDRTIVSDANTGGGPALGMPGGIAIEAGGQLIVLDGSLNGNPRVLRIDPTSGNRSIVSDANTGSGPALGGLPGAVTLDAQGRIFAVLIAAPFGVIMRIDPTNGDRTALPNFPGNLMAQAWGMAVEAGGQLVVAVSPDAPVVYRADPNTGDSSVVSSANVGGGLPFMGMLTGIAVDANGQLLVTDFMFAGQGAGWVYQVDPISGNRSMFSPRQ